MLHPSLSDPSRLACLATRWERARSLRIEPFLEEAVAAPLLAELRSRPHAFRAAEPSRFNFQFWELEIEPCAACAHPLCRFARWLFGDGAAWLEALTGMELGPPPHGSLIATHYDKGCYLDPHSDADGDRVLAYVVGLTPTPMAEPAGGHLEFLERRGRDLVIGEQRPPGYNSVDLFDVRGHDFVHRVALVTEACERRAISGWLWRPGFARPAESA